MHRRFSALAATSTRPRPSAKISQKSRARRRILSHSTCAPLCRRRRRTHRHPHLDVACPSPPSFPPRSENRTPIPPTFLLHFTTNLTPLPLDSPMSLKLHLPSPSPLTPHLHPPFRPPPLPWVLQGLFFRSLIPSLSKASSQSSNMTGSGTSCSSPRIRSSTCFNSPSQTRAS